MFRIQSCTSHTLLRYLKNLNMKYLEKILCTLTSMQYCFLNQALSQTCGQRYNQLFLLFSATQKLTSSVTSKQHLLACILNTSGMRWGRLLRRDSSQSSPLSADITSAGKRSRKEVRKDIIEGSIRRIHCILWMCHVTLWRRARMTHWMTTGHAWQPWCEHVYAREGKRGARGTNVR